MRVLGLLLLLFGATTLVLYTLEQPFAAFDWIGTWGPEVAWAIRIGSLVLGVVLLMAGKKKNKKG